MISTTWKQCCLLISYENNVSENKNSKQQKTYLIHKDPQISETNQSKNVIWSTNTDSQPQNSQEIILTKSRMEKKSNNHPISAYRPSTNPRNRKHRESEINKIT